MRFSVRAVVLAVALAIQPTLAMAEGQPMVAVAGGEVQGVSQDGVDVFRGIPYAAPPVGDLRWQPPAPAASWQGVRQADAFGPACPQPAIGDSAAAMAPLKQSEDCLTLNVWAPAKHDGPLPVMVWIHGGAHRLGAGSLPYYDGTAFARDGVILVTLNYRLGLLGYFAHPALTAAAPAGQPLANYGMMDQIAALNWVQRNIAAFGGDPRNVTVFGESAGAVETLMLLSAPSAKGLFAKAIVESGGGWNDLPDLAKGEAITREALEQTGANPDAPLADLRKLPADSLLGFKPAVGFGPIVDGRLVRAGIPQSFAAGDFADVPLMIGFNSDEGSLMEAFGIPPETILAPLPRPLRALLKLGYGERAPDDAALAKRLFADGGFSAPARWVAGQASEGAPSYLYRFDYVPEALAVERDGARHGGEIPFVFETLAAVPGLGGQLTARDRAMAAMMHSCWVSFARTGVPSCEGAPGWPAYDRESDTLMNFGADTAPVSGFDARILNGLQRILLPRVLKER